MVIHNGKKLRPKDSAKEQQNEIKINKCITPCSSLPVRHFFSTSEIFSDSTTKKLALVRQKESE